jgi:hypothetical protein
MLRNSYLLKKYRNIYFGTSFRTHFGGKSGLFELLRRVTRKRSFLKQRNFMKIGDMRVSKADGSQIHDLQMDALLAAGVAKENIHEDAAFGKVDDRPGLTACLTIIGAEGGGPSGRN